MAEEITPRSYSSKNNNTAKLSVEGKATENSRLTNKEEGLSSSDNTTDFRQELLRCNNKRIIRKNLTNNIRKGINKSKSFLHAHSSISDF